MPSSPQSRSPRILSSVTAAGRRRRSTRAWCRVDGELRRPELRHPLGDERGRGARRSPRRLPPAATRPLPAVLRSRLGHGGRDRPPAWSGPHRRGLPRPRSGRARLHACPCDRIRRPDRRARAYEPHVLARRRHVEGRLQDRVGPAQAPRNHRRRPAPKRSSWRRSPFGSCREPGYAPKRACAAPASKRSAHSPRSATSELHTLVLGSLGPLLAEPRARHRPARPRARSRARIGLGGGHVRARPDDRERLHDEVRRLLPACRRAPPQLWPLRTDGDGQDSLR